MPHRSDAQTLAWLDQQDRRTTEIIRAHGWAVEYIFGEANSPPFAYTIGLFGLGHPELIVFGLDSGSAMRILNMLAERVEANQDLRPGEIAELEGTSTRIRVDPFPHPERALFAANRFYQRPDEASVPALQITWDVDGAFPGEPEYSLPAWLQPAPGKYRG
ncbi:DUF4262 domain-containing protein [Agrococcus baldri]|nr:DUF4262 domain-containing protein [Agrococcus baldri]